MSVLPAPVTCSSVTLQRPQAAASSGVRFTPRSFKAAEPVSLLPLDWEAGYRAQRGTESAANRGPARSLPCSPGALAQPLGSPCPSEAPARPLLGPGAQARSVDAGRGGGRGVETCETRSRLPTEAGSGCRPGVRTHSLGPQTVVTRYS